MNKQQETTTVNILKCVLAVAFLAWVFIEFNREWYVVKSGDCYDSTRTSSSGNRCLTYEEAVEDVNSLNDQALEWAELESREWERVELPIDGETE